jgi:hypothetical protein
MAKQSATQKRQPSPIVSYAYAVRATMIDGSAHDLLLFAQRSAAEDYAAYVRGCRSFGHESIEVIERRIIGGRSLASAA